MANVIVGIAMCYKALTAQAAALQYEARCSLPELYCLTLYSSPLNIVSLLLGISSMWELKSRKKKYDLTKAHKGTSEDSMNRQKRGSLKNIKLGETFEGNLLQVLDFIDKETAIY